MNDFEKCIKNRRLEKIVFNKDMIEREIKTADYDLSRALKNHEEGDFKWSAIQAYYSMFHSAKGLVLSRGYREKSHRCLLVALEELFVSSGIITVSLVSDFELCMDIRHEADYGLIYSGTRSKTVIDTAREWQQLALKILDDVDA